MLSKANGNGRAMRPAFPTSEMNAQQRSARVDQLVVDVNALKVQIAALESRIGALEARVTSLEAFISTGSERQTAWQRLRWLVRG